MLKLSPWPMQAVFWASVAVTGFLSLVPTELLPQVFNWWDKAQHALGFALLTALGFMAYPNARWRLPVGLLLFGAFVELAQAATGWRHGDGLDLLADALGIVAVITARSLGRQAARRAPPSDGG